MTTLRWYALYLLRAIGIFALARYVTRRQLRILCYHGFSIGAEHEIDPTMFMRARTFEARLRILRRRRIPVITLDEAVRRLPQGSISNAETVITLDDGWASNLTVGAPLLEKYGYPACIYLSTEHLEAGTEVFNVTLYHLIRRSPLQALRLAGLHPQLDGTYDIRTDPKAATVELIRKAERAFPLAQRQRLLRPIAGALAVDIDELLRDGRLQLLSRAQVQEAFRRGLDIQLHTHTHRLPDSGFEEMAAEVRDNRRMIQDITGVEPRHFCYPSGEHSRQHPEWLRRLGIASATTCNPGLNSAATPVMLLNRFLDNDAMSDIVFEAKICGVRALAERLGLMREPLSGSDSRQSSVRPADSARSR
jgi:peptidoglycan/xylan/chitin deacetylase (PgdA/CDA1 family)